MKSWRSAYSAFAPAHLFEDPLEKNMSARWDTWPADRLIRVAVDGRILAFAAVEFTPSPYLDNLHVDPDHKSSGIGRRLMSDVARVLLAKQHKTLRLTVIEGNLAARAFYRRIGGREGTPAPDFLLGEPISAVPVDWDATALSRLSEAHP
ncbi:MAG: GNAT family N-acetyltransferase [Pseudomonadota bacterium]